MKKLIDQVPEDDALPLTEMTNEMTNVLQKIAHELERIADAVEKSEREVVSETTPSLLGDQASRDLATNFAEVLVETNDTHIALADGRVVEADLVAALDRYDAVWPGATLPQARPAVVHAIIAAYEKGKPNGIRRTK